MGSSSSEGDVLSDAIEPEKLEKQKQQEKLEKQQKLEKLREQRIIEYDRYYQTVLLTLGFKNHLEAHAKNCRFISAEPIFRNKAGDEIRPDIVLQYNEKRGVLCEVKTSLPFPDDYLLQSLRQLEKYSQEAIGWNTPDRMVEGHEILLFCYTLDYDRVIGKLKQWIERGAVKLSHNLCVCEWSMILNPKIAKEVLLIRLRDGKTGCDELNGILTNNVVINIQQLVIEVEKCKFTRKEPPVEYTMVELWLNIFPEINRNTEDFEALIGDILKVTYDYYIPWSNINGEYSQVRETWIKKAMASFCEIGLAEQVGGNPNCFKIFQSKETPKNIRDYIIDSLCTKLLGITTTKLPIETEGRALRKISEYF